jgi:hypothetical protein
MELLIVPALLLALYLIYAFSRRPDHAVTAILLLTLVNAWLIYPPSINIGLNVYLYDPLFIVILVSALFRIVFQQQIYYVNYLWLVVGLIFSYNFFVGIKLSGSAAGVGFRGDFYFWSGTLYFMSFQYSNEVVERILKIWYRLCLILLAIIYFRFVAEFLNLPIAQTWILSDNNMGLKFRVTHSTFAYLLSVTSVMIFARYFIPSAFKPSKIITSLFIFAILALQHRSVWAATVAGILSAALLPGVKSARLLSNLVVVAVFGLIVMVPLMLYGVTDVFFGSINEAANRATNLNTGTFGDRMNGWLSFINHWEKVPLGYQLLGEPFGDSMVGLKMALHNFYLQMIKDAGLIGFICIVLLYITTLARLFFNARRSEQHRLYYAMFFMLLIGQLTFYIPYANQAQHGIILGMAVSLSRRKILETQPLNNQTETFINTAVASMNRTQHVRVGA